MSCFRAYYCQNLFERGASLQFKRSFMKLKSFFRYSLWAVVFGFSLASIPSKVHAERLRLTNGQALEGGYSTASEAVRQMGFGAGMGLPNMKRNVDDMKVHSEVGKGTTVELTVYLN